MLKNNIITERLIIRNIAVKDAEDVYNIWGSEDNEKYMSDPVMSLDEVRDICVKRQSKNENNGYLTVATLKETGEIIGTCCFGCTDKTYEWGFGYSIKKDHWGKGFATEVVKSVIEFGCSQGILAFVTSCAAENIGSGRVLEKCGMTHEDNESFTNPKTGITYVSHVYKKRC